MERHFIFKNKAAMMRVLTHNPGIYTGRNHSIGGDYKESNAYLPMLYQSFDNQPDINQKQIAKPGPPIDPIPQWMTTKSKKQQKGNGFDRATEEALKHPIKVLS